MQTFELNINNQVLQVEAPSDMPLLWVLRDILGMTGTKYGCGIAQCGACTVHLDNMPVRSCSLPVASIQNRKITTIDGLSEDGDHPVQQAWEIEDVPQCGYCQSGQIMSAVALLNSKTSPTDQEINSAMKGNICRCGTYPKIRKAIHLAAKLSVK